MKEKIKQSLSQLKTTLPAIFLAFKDAETPFLAKILAFLTLAYALSPIDLIPDFIPVLGYLDDAIILPLLAALSIKLIPEAVWQRSLAKSRGLWDQGKPKKWYYALPVILFWLLIIYLIAKILIQRSNS